MQRQILRTVAATFSLLLLSLNPANANDQVGNAANGESKIAMCIGCHGIVGYQSSFPEVYKVPMISGQTSKYIVNSLKAYQNGERKHPTMRSVAKGLSEQDMLDIAAYYEKHATSVTLPEQANPAPAKVSELLTKGACNSCHGANYSKPIDPSFPKIAGQSRDYLFVALKSYKSDGNTTWGRSNAIMGGVAKQFSNAELKELANYIGRQPGELQVVPQAKFR
jgi:cytochrome c553